MQSFDEKFSFYADAGICCRLTMSCHCHSVSHVIRCLINNDIDSTHYLWIFESFSRILWTYQNFDHFNRLPINWQPTRVLKSVCFSYLMLESSVIGQAVPSAVSHLKLFHCLITVEHWTICVMILGRWMQMTCNVYVFGSQKKIIIVIVIIVALVVLTLIIGLSVGLKFV